MKKLYLLLFSLLLLSGCAATGSTGQTASNLLPLEGAYNVRSLAGYHTHDGRRVKENTIYRSGDLHKLTENDLKLLEKLGLKTVVDFRTQEEKSQAAHRLPKTVSKIVELPINPGNVMAFTKLTPENADSAMGELNKKLATEHQAEYAEFFKTLADARNIPVLFNCSAGKDRTGFAAALFLSAVGVDKETILKDYLLSKDYLQDKYAPYIAKYPGLDALFTVKPEFIEAAFNEIDTRYGGMDAYLENELGVGAGMREKLRELYTE